MTNLDKVLWPEVGFTKGEMVDYYERIAPVLLPHLAGRPLTLRRFPDGVAGASWYQVECTGRPDWVATARVPSTVLPPRMLELCVVDDLPSLMWVVNLATVELHPLLGTKDALDRPTALVLDLDPGPPAGMVECCRVALWARRLLVGLGLESFVKTSGLKGLHVYVPLNADETYRRTKPFALAVAELLVRDHPDDVVCRMARTQRAGRVFLDWSQNDPSKSTVAAYSLRAQPSPTVSTPLQWAEVEAGTEGASLVFGPDEVLTRGGPGRRPVRPSAGTVPTVARVTRRVGRTSLQDRREDEWCPSEIGPTPWTARPRTTSRRRSPGWHGHCTRRPTSTRCWNASATLGSFCWARRRMAPPSTTGGGRR